MKEEKSASWTNGSQLQTAVVCSCHQAAPRTVPSGLGTVRMKEVHEMRAVISLFYEYTDIHYTQTPSLEAAARAQGPFFTTVETVELSLPKDTLLPLPEGSPVQEVQEDSGFCPRPDFHCPYALLPLQSGNPRKGQVAHIGTFWGRGPVEGPDLIAGVWHKGALSLQLTVLPTFLLQVSLAIE